MHIMCNRYCPTTIKSWFTIAVHFDHCSRINSSKSPASGAGHVSEPRLLSQCAKSSARRSVCFCTESGGRARIGLLT
jgi:hypothetical protein